MGYFKIIPISPCRNIANSFLGVQVGWSFEQPDLVKDVSACGRGVWSILSLKVPSNPNYSLLFY